MSEQTCKTVLGLGNLLCRDDGLGIHALRVLQTELGERPEVEWVDGGVLGLNLLPLVEASSHLLVLDAIDAGLEPGAVIELDGDIVPLWSQAKLSEHQVGFQEVLGLAGFRGCLPASLHVLGVQPADLSLGMDLSPQVAAALPEVISRAARIIMDWPGLEC